MIAQSQFVELLTREREWIFYCYYFKDFKWGLLCFEYDTISDLCVCGGGASSQ